MVNYQFGKIYKIVDNTNGNTYIGSTCEDMLSKRMAHHLANYNTFLKGKRGNVKSFEIIKNGDYDIVLIEKSPCNSKDELHQRERYYIENLECINKVIPLRNNKEYYQSNKDKKKKYKQDNAEKIDKYQKEYREKNKVELLQKKKIYGEKNKDEISRKRKEKRESLKNKNFNELILEEN